MSSKHIDLLAFSELPSAVYFRYADFSANEFAAPHRHAWGTLEYAAHGVLHMDIGGSRYMAPPHYAVWVPPQVEHSFYSHQPVNYRAVCLAPTVCAPLPARACTLAISDILKAAIEALESARNIQEIAFDLGYSTASAFIAMFQRQAGCPPEYYRRNRMF